MISHYVLNARATFWYIQTQFSISLRRARFGRLQTKNDDMRNNETKTQANKETKKQETNKNKSMKNNDTKEKRNKQ